jgi:hypothetical protein
VVGASELVGLRSSLRLDVIASPAARCVPRRTSSTAATLDIDKFYRTFFLRDVLGYVAPGLLIACALLMGCPDQSVVDRFLVSSSPWKLLPLSVVTGYFLGVVNREVWFSVIALDAIALGPVIRRPSPDPADWRTQILRWIWSPSRLLYCDLLQLHNPVDPVRSYSLFAAEVSERSRVLDYCDRLMLLQIIYKNLGAAIATASVILAAGWEPNRWASAATPHVLSIVHHVVAAWLPTPVSVIVVGCGLGVFFLFVSGFTLRHYWLNCKIASCIPRGS